jgi:hypothetical protein
MLGFYCGPDPRKFLFILRFHSRLKLKYCFEVPYSQSVVRIRIRNKRGMSLGLPDPDPLVRGMDLRIRIRIRIRTGTKNATDPQHCSK